MPTCVAYSTLVRMTAPARLMLLKAFISSGYGKQIILFFLPTVPISSFVFGGFAKFQLATCPAATSAKSAYKLADSSLLSLIDWPRWARKPFSYRGYR
jgi:hypothetical protein